MSFYERSRRNLTGRPPSGEPNLLYLTGINLLVSLTTDPPAPDRKAPWLPAARPALTGINPRVRPRRQLRPLLIHLATIYDGPRDRGYR